MDTLTTQVEALFTDARRAAVVGAIGDSPDHPGAIVPQPPAGVRAPTVPSASPLSLAIDGAGFFIVQAGGHRTYTRLGDFHVSADGLLVDRGGDAVLGVGVEETDFNRVHPIEVSGKNEITIDSHGIVSGLKAHVREPIARLALAVFPAPERLARLSDVSLRTTGASGPPRLVSAGAPNAGLLRTHALENGLVDLDGDLARLWEVRRRGELAETLASAADSCQRTVLGLVK